MRRIVFYSWQSDLPNATNRSFIQKALENAATAISADDAVDIEPVIDRDTYGVPGAPDIGTTIFSKIAAADVFVADVSIALRPVTGRASPNPNVLIEVGYALRALGHERVLLVFNLAYGAILDLPFDLRMRRVTTYNVSQEHSSRATERVKLERTLDDALRAALAQANSEDSSATVQAISAIELNQANKLVLIRRRLAELIKALDVLQPKRARDGGGPDELVAALSKTVHHVREFSKLAEAAAIMNDKECANEVYQWFSNFIERYQLPEGFLGMYKEADFDYFKFLGHELFVVFVALLIRDNRWAILQNVLAQKVSVNYVRGEGGPANVSWKEISEHLPLLVNESSKQGRVSLHSDILHRRHLSGELAETLSPTDFMAGDFFLFLVSEIPSADARMRMDWRPWSLVYLKSCPMFFRKAEDEKFAWTLVKLLNVPSIEEFKRRLTERLPRLDKLFRGGNWRHPFQNSDIERIGSVSSFN